MEVTKEFINTLRSNLSREYQLHEDGDVLGAFDRAALATVLNGASAPPALTRGQKAARTRAANKRSKTTGTSVGEASDGQ